MKPHDLILLYSGGADSSLLLTMSIQMGLTPYCILIDYEQSHVEELSKAREFCANKGVDCQTVKISHLRIQSKLTDGTVKYAGVSEWHVPSRNLMFISIAASIAESKGITRIWYGANYEDREHLFPDCYQEWVFTLNQLLKINGSIGITIEAPLLGMTKETIVSLLKVNNINQSEIFSGYGRQD